MDFICHVRTGSEVDASTLTDIECTDSTSVDQTAAKYQRAHIEIMACRPQDTYKRDVSCGCTYGKRAGCYNAFSAYPHTGLCFLQLDDSLRRIKRLSQYATVVCLCNKECLFASSMHLQPMTTHTILMHYSEHCYLSI